MSDRARAQAGRGVPSGWRWPGEVTKSTRSTKVLGDWFMTMTTRAAFSAISQAPPDPGSRTVGVVGTDR